MGHNGYKGTQGTQGLQGNTKAQKTQGRQGLQRDTRYMGDSIDHSEIICAVHFQLNFGCNDHRF